MHSSITRRALLRRGAATTLALAVAPMIAGCDPDPGPGQAGSGEPGKAQAEPGARLGLSFPASFGWGAATSAYQIEGAAAEDGRGPSIWDTFSHQSGTVRNGDTGDVAADHYHRYAEDVALMQRLGLRSYRFSMSWSRVLPTGTGPVNQKGLDFYKRLVQRLLDAGIAPMLTLYHWDLPQALQDRGGWVNRDCAEWFADYASVAARALGDVVPTWLTINEPKTIVDVAYRYGAYAPGERDEAKAAVVWHHLLLAHGRGVQAVHAARSSLRVGPALNLAPAYPDRTDDPDDQAAARLADGYENRRYLDPVLKGSYPADVLDDLGALPSVGAALERTIRDGDLAVIATTNDLLAVQYYNPVFVRSGGQYVTKLATSEADWQQIYPDGMYDTLTRIKRDYGDIPLSVTENGRPTTDIVSPSGTVEDPDRITFLRDHLAAAHRAIGDGVRLESYHVWSLLDNFEWAQGYSQRWGLVYVDFGTQQRIPKASAAWYRGVIEQGGI